MGRGKVEETRKLVNGDKILGVVASLVGDFHSFGLISGVWRSWKGECRDGWGISSDFGGRMRGCVSPFLGLSRV